MLESLKRLRPEGTFAEPDEDPEPTELSESAFNPQDKVLGWMRYNGSRDEANPKFWWDNEVLNEHFLVDDCHPRNSTV